MGCRGLRLFLRQWIWGLGIVFTVQSGSSVYAQEWDDILAKAHVVVDPALGVGIRLHTLDGMLDDLIMMMSENKIVFVDHRASGRDDGSTWKHAAPTVHAGLDLLEGEGALWVAQGVYEENIFIPEGVLLFGGFQGIEDDFSDRDHRQYVTVLQGDGIDPVVEMEHRTMIDGFTITGGGGGEANSGGGIFVGDWLSIIRNNIIKDNGYGENDVGWSGGGIFVNGRGPYYSPGDIDGYSPIIVGNLLTHNLALCGDAICTRSSTALIASNTVYNHPTRGIEVVCYPGDEPTIVNCILWDNGDDLYNHVLSTSDPIYLYNCSEDEDGVEGIVRGYPAFNDPDAGDFTLPLYSDCVDAGFPDGPNDPDGSRADMGAFPYFHHAVVNGVEIVLSSIPATNMDIRCDGFGYRSPVTIQLEPNTTHTIHAVKYHLQSSDNRLVFQRWNVGGGRIQQIITTQPQQYQAEYGVQYYLQLITGGVNVVPLGEGWYDEGSNAQIQIDSIVTDVQGTSRHVFNGWTGLGNIAYTGPNTHAEVTVQSPITETANWLQEFRLDIISPFGNPQGSGWYGQGVTANIEVDSLVHISDNTRVRFQGWQGTGAESYSGSDNTATVVVYSPIVQTAYWMTQYRLQLLTDPPGLPSVAFQVTPPGLWYDAGTTVQIEAVSSDEGKVFSGWTGDVVSNDNPIAVIVDKPISITATYSGPNLAPVTPILPDTVMQEDGLLSLSYEWVNQFVADPNDPVETLEWTFFSEDILHYTNDTTLSEVRFTPALNWNGVSNVTFQITDPSGLTSSDTFQVTVMPVNDPPGAFSLIEPSDGSVVSVDSSTIQYLWQVSPNVDPGDSIKYSLFLGETATIPDPLAVKIATTSDTVFRALKPADGIYYWSVLAEDTADAFVWSDMAFRIDIQTGLGESGTHRPIQFDLAQNVPNPFNAITTIPFYLGKSGPVQIEVYDVHGRSVRRLVDTEMAAGQHEVRWDGKDDSGKHCPTGIYAYRLVSAEGERVRKMLYLK